MNTDDKKKSSQDLQFWKNATRRLKRGVILATLLLVAYNLLLFLDIHTDNGIKGLGSIVGYFVVTIIVAFFCIRNYRLGLARFSSLLNLGGRSAVRLIVWGFNCTVIGAILHLLVFLMLQNRLSDNVFLSLCIGNSLLILATVLGSIGFLSLATSKGLPHDSRRGALHMSWTNIVMLVGTFLTAYCLSAAEISVLFKVLVVAVNILGAFFFYRNWDLLLRPKDEEEEATTETTPAEAATATETHAAETSPVTNAEDTRNLTVDSSDEGTGNIDSTSSQE